MNVKKLFDITGEKAIVTGAAQGIYCVVKMKREVRKNSKDNCIIGGL